MKITADNIDKLTWQAKVDLLRKIVEGAIELDQRNEDIGAVDCILFNTLDMLDNQDNEDGFGTQGWRYSILGED